MGKTDFLAALSVLALASGCGSTPGTSSRPGAGKGKRLENLPFVLIGDRKIHYRRWGEGPDLVLLHGLGDSSVGWRSLGPELSRLGYRVTAWDALGAGRSLMQAGDDLTLPAHVRRLVEFMDRLGIREAVLLGHSLGGGLALLAAEREPERIKALILINPAAYPEAAERDRWFWETPFLAELVLKLMPSRLVVRIGLRQNFHDPEKIPPELTRLYLEEVNRKGVVEGFIAQVRQLLFPGARESIRKYAEIRCPVLILWGTKDEILPLRDAERLAEDLPQAKLVELDDCAHSPHFERPEIVLETISRFLAGEAGQSLRGRCGRIETR